MMILKLIVLGGIGQLIRVLAGIKKRKQLNLSVDWVYIVSTILLGMCIGGALGYLFRSDYIAFFSGYAGVDFVENMYKIYVTGKVKRKRRKRK